ncbi:MAG: VacJ family lipoprotein, partial [bacterium]|nr:VacJ family lipoprotein [bacterium]
STPVYLISDLTQLKFEQFADHTGRFVVNTTFGVAGLFDVAAEHANLPRHHEDFGTALGYYEIPAGPYIVLPFLGPSNVRDGLGRIIDSVAQPVSWALPMTSASDDVVFFSNVGLRALDAIDTRAGLLEAFEAGREGSIDFYSFLRSTYFQRRHALIYDLDQDKPADNNTEDEWLEDDN